MSDEVRISRMLGRLSDGFESDTGYLWHARIRGSYAAACGKSPGPRSVGWSEETATAVTCARCRTALIRAVLWVDSNEHFGDFQEEETS